MPEETSGRIGTGAAVGSLATPGDVGSAGGSGVRPMSYGEKAVGLTFNPSNDPLVQQAKELYAKLIDIADAVRKSENGPSEKGRLASVAITEAQSAQMWLVKAITYKD